MRRLDMEKTVRIMRASRTEIEARGGYFGALQLIEEVKALRTPEGGGRPTNPAWEKRLIGVSPRTEKALDEIASQMSQESSRPIGPMQVAALLLDRAVGQYQANEQLARIEAEMRKSAVVTEPVIEEEPPSVETVDFTRLKPAPERRKKRAVGGSR